jgi:tRNA/rRNA methyltransferase
LLRRNLGANNTSYFAISITFLSTEPTQLNIMISVILIEPETSGNIGSIARAMANFGFSELVLVNPKCKIDEFSRRFAKNAQQILENARIEKFDYLEKVDFLIGTTSKLGRDYNVSRTPLMPTDLAEKLHEVKGKKIGLVLGREGDGLYNEEINMCDFIVPIPTSKEYDSMNISHALAILLYEIRKAEYTSEIMKRYTPMGVGEKQQIMKLLDSAMERMHFPDELKKETQRRVWKRMITKAMLTRREAFALMGFLKKANGKR